jgi:beta-N-acetylhexosaminidase
MMAKAQDLLGECFMIGFKGLELSEPTAAFFKQARIGASILFAHNYESPAQVAELCNQIQECQSDLPMWVAVDQEGGRVQRFKKHFTLFPEALAIGAKNSPKLTFDLAEALARELKAVGINVNFAPVADINTNPKNPVIGNRSFGDNEELVTQMVTASVRGHLVGGVLPCVKHFPGHGDTHVDSHLALPRLMTPLETLRDREMKPFIRAFKSRCQMVMTAHILNPQIDPEVPGTLSKILLQDILRGELRYKGIIFSDDMEMQAITDHYGINDAPVRALNAGCDILCYRSEERGRQAYEACSKALHEGRILPQTIITAAERSREIKRETLLPYEPARVSRVGEVVGIDAHAALVRQITG